MPLSSTLLALHDFIQFAFRWTDSHLFEFEIGDRRYGQPEYDRYADERLYKAASIRLKTVVDRGIEQFLYVYDFGDNWRHDLFIEEVRDWRARRRLPGIRRRRASGPSRGRGRNHRLHGVSRSEPEPAPRGARDGGALVRQALRAGRHRRAARPDVLRDGGCPTKGTAHESQERGPWAPHLRTVASKRQTGGSKFLKHPKATAWGAGVMGAAGLIGAVLGPSPLVLPFVPLIAAGPCAVRGRDGCGWSAGGPRGARDCGEGSVRRVERGAGCGGGETHRILAGEPASAKGGRAVVAAEKRGRGHSARGLDPKVLHERALSRLHRQYERRTMNNVHRAEYVECLVDGP